MSECALAASTCLWRQVLEPAQPPRQASTAAQRGGRAVSASVFAGVLYGLGGALVFQRVVHACATSTRGCDSSCAMRSNVARPMPRLVCPPHLPARRNQKP